MRSASSAVQRDWMARNESRSASPSGAWRAISAAVSFASLITAADRMRVAVASPSSAFISSSTPLANAASIRRCVRIGSASLIGDLWRDDAEALTVDVRRPVQRCQHHRLAQEQADIGGIGVADAAVQLNARTGYHH